MRGALIGPMTKGLGAAAIVAAALLAGASGASAAGCPANSPYATAVTGTPGVVSYWRLGESTGTSADDHRHRLGLAPGGRYEERHLRPPVHRWRRPDRLGGQPDASEQHASPDDRAELEHLVLQRDHRRRVRVQPAAVRDRRQGALRQG